MKKAVFLDRDGVINEDLGYVHKIKDFIFLPEVLEALKILQKNGYLLFIITNQSGIGRGYYTKEDYFQVTNHMLNEFKKNDIKIEKINYCPHHPQGIIDEYKKDCDCRKPNVGMIKSEIIEYDIDVNNSYLIGDKESDIKAALKIGFKSALIKTKYGSNYGEDYLGKNLSDVVKNYILNKDL